MFRNVPECSGMFRVPGVIDARICLHFLGTQNFNLLETAVVVSTNRKTWFVNLLSLCRINDHFYKSRTLSMAGFYIQDSRASHSTVSLLLAVRRASVLERGKKTNNYLAPSNTEGFSFLIPKDSKGDGTILLQNTTQFIQEFDCDRRCMSLASFSHIWCIFGRYEQSSLSRKEETAKTFTAP